MMMQAWSNYLDELRSREAQGADIGEAAPDTDVRFSYMEIGFHTKSLSAV